MTKTIAWDNLQSLEQVETNLKMGTKVSLASSVTTLALEIFHNG